MLGLVELGLVGWQVKVFKTVQAVRDTECNDCLCKERSNFTLVVN